MPEAQLIHVIDDDEAVRESLAFMLSTSAYEVRQHESAAAFLRAGLPSRAGCIITDVRMPGLSGVELLQKLDEVGSRIPVIVMTGHADVPLAVEAMKLGAADFLEKPFDEEVMLKAIRACLTRADETSRMDALRTDVEARIGELSPRERQVLTALVAGQANKSIAQDLGISPRTVEVYRANVMTKMKVSSLSELVRMALLAGIGAFNPSRP